jgi:hypothetical protein
MSLSYPSLRLRQDGAFQAGNAPYGAKRITREQCNYVKNVKGFKFIDLVSDHIV